MSSELGKLSAMPISPFYKSIRDRIGSALLLFPGVAAIIRDERGRVLLQQNHEESWGLPAGAIEPGESPGVAVIREVFEETGLRVRPRRIAGILGGSSCRVRYSNGDEVEYVVTVFDCEVVGGELIASNEETRTLAYFQREQMPRLAFGYPNEVFDETRTSPYFA